MFFAVIILMPKSSRKLSTVIVWLLILMSYIPVLTIFAMKDESRIFTYAITAFWIAVFHLLRLPDISLPSLKHKKLVSYLILACLSVIAFLINYVYFGFSINTNLIDLTKVYGVRVKYGEANAPLAGYFFNWQAFILNPILCAIFVLRKRCLWAALIVVFQLYLFSTTGHKTYLFTIPLALALMWASGHKNPLAYIAIGFTVLTLLGMLSYLLMGDVIIPSLFPRRVLFIPALTYFLYYDFFSEHDLLYLSTQRIFRLFLDYPYDVSTPHLIGGVYYNQPKMGVNTGIVGDAYMNFGFLGLILWSVLLAAVLKLADSCSKGRDIRIGIVAIAAPIVALTNSALLTSLVSHGLLLAFMLLYLMPKNRAPIASSGRWSLIKTS